jgi:uncharacterized damage-inducible protein DinB
MNVDAFRQLYDYHFAENRKLWDNFIRPLPQEKFIQPVDYSIGSIREHLVHMMSVDDAWFSDLRGVQLGEPLVPADFDNRDTLRAEWDNIEQHMRDYLATLTDEALFQKPFHAGEDENLILWQVLIHVVNHGTDHRAQLLRLLHDCGVKTAPQDFVFYLYDYS